MLTMNFQMFKLFFEKAGEPEINCQHLLDHQKSEFQKNIYFCFIDYAKVFVWITTNWKILKETTWPASWETWMQVRKQQLELDMEQQTGSK